MEFFVSRAMIISLCLVLAGCNSPRGAGFQAEVLAAGETDPITGEEIFDFAVFAVTRETTSDLEGWPSTGTRGYRWITRQAQPASLIIAAGDTMAITVWDADENSLLVVRGQRQANLGEMQVSSTGRIFIPFVGEMQVSGMAPQTARARIQERLSETSPSAQVQLSVVPGRANTADLVSGANAPGVYPLPDRDFTLLNLLSQGGGARRDLLNPQVRLIRGDQIYGTSLARLYENPRLDTTLRGGDRIIIEPDARYFLSLGAAGTEALHAFSKDHVSALDALSIIGGVNDARANPQGILILREYSANAVRHDDSGPPQTRVVFTLDLTSADGLFSAGNFTVMSGDLIYATESPVTTARTILGLLGATIGVVNRL